KPGMITAYLLVIMDRLAEFGKPIRLSGRYEVLAVKIYTEITSFYNIGGAATLALLLLIPSLLAFWGQRLFLKKSVMVVSGKSQSSDFDWMGKTPRLVLFLICLLFSGLVFLMYGTLCLQAFSHADNFSQAWQLSSKSLIDSVALAALSGPITSLLGIVLAYFVVRKRFFGRRLLESVSLFAFAVPGTVLGLSYAVTFSHPVAFLPSLQGTAAILLILFVVRNLPVGMQAGMASLKQIDPSIEEAAKTLGAKGWTLFRRITLPMLAPAFFTGWAYSFVKAITAISAVIFVVSGKWSLVTVDILGLVENGELAYAAALSVMLIGIVLAVLGLIKLFVRAL
ncbi:MAG: ABC transporter permease subunit, partial [Deltaproteobacteria bacterium]|nr:ABC transporter permease subunit [Deltaproteobacteria bacterium]